MLEDADFARLGVKVKELPAMQRQADEVVAARTGGGVSLAVGMARVFSGLPGIDRKSTRLNSSHPSISYAVFCLKKKKKKTPIYPWGQRRSPPSPGGPARPSRGLSSRGAPRHSGRQYSRQRQ